MPGWSDNRIYEGPTESILWNGCFFCVSMISFELVFQARNCSLMKRLVLHRWLIRATA